MDSPLYYRKQISFFYDKSAKEIQQDPYERFDPMVIRQSALHLADELWDDYLMESIIQYFKPILNDLDGASIVELGCGVGRWIADIANKFPTAHCWGIDYSYQMLKMAHEVWLNQACINLDLSRYGFSSNYNLRTFGLKNLQFGLSKASSLPFENQSQDLVFSSFLLDRLDDPIESLKEMRRILRPKGKMILITPLNFNKAKHWEQFYPSDKIHEILAAIDYEILDWQESLFVEEQLDLHGNSIHWNCLGFVCQRK